MSFFEKRYIVHGWNGGIHLLTARGLYERVMEDSKLDNYDWIASATELVRVCNEPYFPKEYAQEIKIAILKCFTNLETQRDQPSYREPTDYDIVYSCYNSLSSKDEKVAAAKQKFLRAVIWATQTYHFEVPLIFYGEAYQRVCREWREAKFVEYVSKPELDFKKLRQILDEDFDKMVKEEDAKGTFEKDRKLALEALTGFWTQNRPEDFS